MLNRWNEHHAARCEGALLKLRVYTSQLLGADPDLVLYGGGNTSVKTRATNVFGETEDILYVKGSGWDLATIETPGFAPVRMEVLLKMAQLDELTDSEMVRLQRTAMTNPDAPNPSVEAILHAIIPFTFVDHTHADAVVTLSNTPHGLDRINALYGERHLVVPYVMPGFSLAREIYRQTREVDWDALEGIILMNHGVFTFAHDARVSYDRMINIVSRAEEYLANHTTSATAQRIEPIDPMRIAELRGIVSATWGKPILARQDTSGISGAFTGHPALEKISSRGPLTPDHIIRTKRTPVILRDDVQESIKEYRRQYIAYFSKHTSGEQMLDPAPRWAVAPNQGTFAFGPTPKHIKIIEDITRHTMKSILQAEQLESWQALGAAELFEMEYWELEQAKLGRGGSSPEMEGKIALVTGGASGIGRACAEQLVSQGCVVGVLDINPQVAIMFSGDNITGIECDVTSAPELASAIEQVVRVYGGLDYVIANAGIFPPTSRIGDMHASIWDRSLTLNLTSQQQLLKLCLPFLKLGIEPAVVIVGSKNVPAPGPGAAAYSVAKAGATQLARVASMEFAPFGIRVNVVHPDAVFDTGSWTDDVLQERARQYGLSVGDYKTKNLLQTEITSADVAAVVSALLDTLFSKTTGAQIPIDGGNPRVI